MSAAANRVASVAGLDVGAVTDWLASTVSALRTPLTFDALGDGQSNLTFLVTDANGAQLVLRRPPLGKLLESAHDVGREHGILVKLQPTTVPTPAVLAFTSDPAVTDVPLIAMQHIEGLVVNSRPVAENLPETTRTRIGPALARTLGEIHAVNLEKTRLIHLASHLPYAGRQLARWRRQWAESRTRDLPAIEEIADGLEAAVPTQRELSLVHGDFHLLNVIIEPDGSSIRAVLDWELATLGDPLADLGCLLAYWPEPTDPSGQVFQASRLPAFSSRHDLVEAYVQQTGRDVTELRFWHALALWKLAIICEGVRRRRLDRPNDIRIDTPPSELVDELVERATIAADGAAI